VLCRRPRIHATFHRVRRNSVPAALIRRETSSRLSTVGNRAAVFGIRQKLPKLMALEGFYKEEPQIGYTVHRSAGCYLALLQQVSLIASQLVRPQPIWRLAKMASERSHVLQVFASCDLGIVAALEFLQHHLA